MQRGSPESEPTPTIRLASYAREALKRVDRKGRTYASNVDYHLNRWMFYRKKEEGLEPIREDEVERLIKESMDPNSTLSDLTHEEDRVSPIYGPKGWDNLIYLIGMQVQKRTIKDVLNAFLRVLHNDSVKAINEDAIPLHALANVATILRFIDEGRLTDQVVAANAGKGIRAYEVGPRKKPNEFGRSDLAESKPPETRRETAWDQAVEAVRFLAKEKNKEGDTYFSAISKMLMEETGREGSDLPNWEELKSIIAYSIKYHLSVADPLMLEEGEQDHTYGAVESSLAFALDFAQKHVLIVTGDNGLEREFRNRLITAVIEAKQKKNNGMILHAMASYAGILRLIEKGLLNNSVLMKYNEDLVEHFTPPSEPARPAQPVVSVHPVEQPSRTVSRSVQPSVQSSQPAASPPAESSASQPRPASQPVQPPQSAQRQDMTDAIIHDQPSRLPPSPPAAQPVPISSSQAERLKVEEAALREELTRPVIPELRSIPEIVDFVKEKMSSGQTAVFRVGNEGIENVINSIFAPFRLGNGLRIEKLKGIWIFPDYYHRIDLQFYLEAKRRIGADALLEFSLIDTENGEVVIGDPSCKPKPMSLFFTEVNIGKGIAKDLKEAVKGQSINGIVSDMLQKELGDDEAYSISDLNLSITRDSAPSSLRFEVKGPERPRRHRPRRSDFGPGSSTMLRR